MIEPLLSDDTFLADVESQPRSAARLDIWWLGQSGYLLQIDQQRILIDPYLSESLTKKYALTQRPHVRISRRVVDPARLTGITLVTCSHVHTDHLDAETLAPIISNNPRLTFVGPRSIQEIIIDRLGRPADVLLGDSESVELDNEITITAVLSVHGAPDHDVQGNPLFLGYIIRVGRFSVYHSGDTIAYPGLADQVRPHDVDVVFVPINGLLGNMNALEAAELCADIHAPISVPCHYDMFDFNTAPPQPFEARCDALGVRSRVLQLGERMTIIK